EAARRAGTPLAAAADAFFVHPSSYPLHRLLRAIGLNTKLGRLRGQDTAPAGAWLMPPERLAAALPDCPQALDAAGRIAADCALSDPPWNPAGRAIFPSYDGMRPEETMERLRALCTEGARRRYGELPGAVRLRLERELDIIGRKGLADYFLMVHDIVQQSPRTCGRGSAASSAVSYCLGITHVDPVRYDLFFERFLNEGRVDPPDIDVDFAWDERDAVLDYVFQRYGRRRAAMVSNHLCFRGRAAVREVAKVYGLPEEEIKAVTGRLARTWQTAPAEEMVRGHPLFKGLDLRDPWPEVLRWAARLEGHPRHLSVHCGGVVVVPGEVSDHVPTQPAPKGVDIIQWEKDATEDSGLVKMDLLGNRSLAVIRDALAAVRRRHGVEIVWERFDPLDDLRTQDLIRRGDTVGVFYVESPAMRQLQHKTGTGDFEHLVIHSSIIRPAANSYIREYVRRLKGGAYRPLHPLLGDLMKETHGIMVYQEDVAKTVIAMAGFDAASADDLRKVLSRKHKRRKLEDHRLRFEAGARERGFSAEVIAEVWRMILSFSGYSFCKPHSASYALVSFKSAYLKAHHPAEFMAAVLSNQGGYYSTFAYVSECRRMGLAVRLPDVNESGIPYTGSGREVRVGLMQVQGLSAGAMEALLRERESGGPFGSLEDLLDRVVLDPADARRLIKAGAFDGVSGGAGSRPGLMWRWARWNAARAGRARGSRP
ncbi:MAG TPA: DNA polymerase III subunit alpha, partial [Candidatus Polarisedimenticolia bacterium]|nr:DNA polymerase III subunit alpha [Candidatus Polarisedimenticolia bacterium]